MKYFEFGKEHPEQFLLKVQVAHRQSLQKEKL